MVISHKYKYIFVELPRTGTTAISDQLVKLYDGEKILIKHASYRNFLKFYKNKYSDYFVFACTRNPLDRTVSSYEKLKKGRFTEDISPLVNSYFKSRMNYLKRTSSFEDYFLRFYKLPYDDWGSLDHNKFNFLIRFESLQEDFKTVLEKLGIEQIQSIPMINKTSREKEYPSYYTSRIQKRATYVFGPYCERFGYNLPWQKKKMCHFFIIFYTKHCF